MIQGQLKVTVTYPAHQLATHASSTNASHHGAHSASLSSDGSHAASVSEASGACAASTSEGSQMPLPRHRGDIVSVAAPKRSSQAQQTSAAGGGQHSLENLGSQINSGHALPSQHTPADESAHMTDAQEPAAVLKTQMQQLSELSQLLSQRLQLQDTVEQPQGKTSWAGNASDPSNSHAQQQPTSQQLGLEPSGLTAVDGAEYHLAESGNVHQPGSSSAQTDQLASTENAFLPVSPPASDCERFNCRGNSAQQQQPGFTVRTVLAEDSHGGLCAKDEAGQQHRDADLQFWGAASDEEGHESGRLHDVCSHLPCSVEGTVQGNCRAHINQEVVKPIPQPQAFDGPGPNSSLCVSGLCGVLSHLAPCQLGPLSCCLLSGGF